MVTTSSVSASEIAKCIPLNQIESKYHPRLLTGLKTVEIAAGKLILRKARDPRFSHYLLSGSVEVRNSFENRFTLTAEDTRCQRPIENLLGDTSTVRANAPCRLLICNQTVLDELMTWSQDYSIHFLEDGDIPLPDTTLIDDSFQEDWDNVFLQSALAANLSNNAIHQLFAALEDIEVKEGETIVQKDSPADYFYIVKRGEVIVITDPDGPYRGARFNLAAGQYFGDEALVANTVRNATVMAGSGCSVGRLDQDTFNTLIKSHLVSPATDDITTSQPAAQIIDVRFDIESRLAPIANSMQIPIPSLRRQLSDIDSAGRYIIAPANDARSELATYLMRQAGFEAYHMVSSVQT